MMKIRKPMFGAAYYPEVWPEAEIEREIPYMKEAGMNVMRIAEFAWSRLEPREGVFDFDWLHRVVERLGREGIATLLCTPTCTPPAWLTAAHPEVLIMNDLGVRGQHGARRHACPNHPVYRDYCRKIVTRLGEAFGGDERVIGWQIDNELYMPGGWGPANRGCCCPVCHGAFIDAMRKKFATVEAMNAAWCLDLWSQAYSDFAQLPVPRADIGHHPSLLTAWMRFQSDSYAAFAAAQAEILHRLSKAPVGTDMMPTLGLSYRDTNRTLDVVQFNHYHGMAQTWVTVFWMDYLRTLKEAPFWNTETSTCWNGGTSANGYREPGYCRVNSWLPAALGGEATLYWLWRSHWSGQEDMHGSVLTSAARPLHTFGEVKEVGRGFEACAEVLSATRPVKSGLALHFSDEAWWQFQFQPMVNGFRYNDKLPHLAYRPLLGAQLRPDVIDPSCPLEEYRVVFSPFLPCLEEQGLQGRLARWIEAGGLWVAGPLTDVRNLEASKYAHAPYGVLEDWAGVRGLYQIPGDPRDFALRWKDGRPGKGSVWYDSFEPQSDTEILAFYTEGPMAGRAAITRRAKGKGAVIALGTMPQPDDLATLMAALCKEKGILPAFPAAPNILAVPRAGQGKRALCVIELENKPGWIRLPHPMKNLLDGKLVKGKVAIAPYTVMFLEG
ncbi:MAG: beta-galactosidase [Spirochaetes bacterium]|nr:beta-galactosidase [Spirochaetota bacterium]